MIHLQQEVNHRIQKTQDVADAKTGSRRQRRACASPAVDDWFSVIIFYIFIANLLLCHNRDQSGN